MDNFDFKKYLAEGKLLKEEINIDIIDDIAILTGDSGKYEGEIEDDGTVSFSVIFDKQGLDTRIIDQYDESNIDEFLGKDHAFVELSKKYDHNWDIEPDLVGITIKLTEGKLQEFRRTGRQYKAQGQGGSAGNRRPGMMGPRGTDQDDINPPIPDDIPSDPYEKKGGEYHNYGSMSIRFMDKDMKEGSLVVLRGYGRNKEGTYHGYIEKSMHGHFIVSFSVTYDDLDFKISDRYDRNNIEEFLGNHAFVDLKNNPAHECYMGCWDIEHDLVGITIYTPNDPTYGKPAYDKHMYGDSLQEGKLKESAIKLGYLKEDFEDKELNILGTDNRDISTTKLILSDGSYVIVNPIELMENALENTDNADLMKQFNAFKIGL